GRATRYDASYSPAPDTLSALRPAVMSTALKGRTHGRTDQRCKREKSSCQPGAVHTWPLVLPRGKMILISVNSPSCILTSIEISSLPKIGQAMQIRERNNLVHLFIGYYRHLPTAYCPGVVNTR